MGVPVPPADAEPARSSAGAVLGAGPGAFAAATTPPARPIEGIAGFEVALGRVGELGPLEEGLAFHRQAHGLGEQVDSGRLRLLGVAAGPLGEAPRLLRARTERAVEARRELAHHGVLGIELEDVAQGLRSLLLVPGLEGLSRL